MMFWDVFIFILVYFSLVFLYLTGVFDNTIIPLALVGYEIIERLRSRLFGISREPRTSRSHVTTALASGLQFEVHVFTARPPSRGK